MSTAGRTYKNASTVEALDNVQFGSDVRVISEFLKTHPFLVPLLVRAQSVINRYFPGSTIHLRYAIEPEAIGETMLVAAIEPNEPPEVAVAKFMQFAEDWWLDALDLAQDKLAITIEYR